MTFYDDAPLEVLNIINNYVCQMNVHDIKQRNLKTIRHLWTLKMALMFDPRVYHSVILKIS